jgi:DNA-binding response OmpR family regulator
MAFDEEPRFIMGSTPGAAGGVIAIVDDDPHISSALSAWLDMLGVASISEASAEHTLSRLVEAVGGWVVRPAPGAAPRPLLGAIIDINLSGANGVELARRLRRGQANLPIVLISAIAGEELRRHGALPAGVSCLCKPFDLDALELALFQRADETGGGASATDRDCNDP